MAPVTVEQLDADMAHLSFTEQLWLVERLVQRLRTHTSPLLTISAHDLATMAADPAIHDLMHQINREFLVAEGDGLVPRA